VVLIFRKQQVEAIISHKNNGCGGVATTNICFEKAYYNKIQSCDGITMKNNDCERYLTKQVYK
jgi:hypothetical protein